MIACNLWNAGDLLPAFEAYRATTTHQPSSNSSPLPLLRSDSPYPNPACRRFAQMHRPAAGAQRHGFVVLALLYFDLRLRPQPQIVQEFQELRIFLVDAEDLGLVVRT